MKSLAFRLILALLLLAMQSVASAQTPGSTEDSRPPISPVQERPPTDDQAIAADNDFAEQNNRSQGQPADLTLGNFFSAGWDDDFGVRSRVTGTPDLTLLRAQTNYLLRVFRVNAFEQANLNSPTNKNLTDLDGCVDWAFNRRFMVEISGAYQWIDPRSGLASNGGAPGMLTRFQLVDTEPSSCCFNFKVAAPNEPLGIDQSTLSYGLAGFEDLAYWCGFKRVGLYYSFLFDSTAGPAAAGAKRTDVQYDVSLAKTVTDANSPIFRNLSLFVENFAQSDLDGPHAGRTFVTVTPGLRFNFATCDCATMGKDNAIMFGTDIPVSTYRTCGDIYRLTYIKSF